MITQCIVDGVDTDVSVVTIASINIHKYNPVAT
jgi:hypothetical protein